MGELRTAAIFCRVSTQWTQSHHSGSLWKGNWSEGNDKKSSNVIGQSLAG